MQTNFQKVAEFCRTFGHPVESSPVYDVFTSNPELVKLRLALNDEEIKELCEAFHERDLVEVIDALADILVVAYGMGVTCGINLDHLMQLTVTSVAAVDWKIATQTTNYIMIKNICRKLGRTVRDNPEAQIFDDPESQYLLDTLVESQAALSEACKNHNLIDTAATLTKVIYQTYVIGTAFGVDMDVAMTLVHKSNMTKLCSSETEAQETVEWYAKEFAEGRVTYDTPNYRKAEDGEYWVVFNESTGKILKSINYKPVDLTVMVNM